MNSDKKVAIAVTAVGAVVAVGALAYYLMSSPAPKEKEEVKSTSKKSGAPVPAPSRGSAAAPAPAPAPVLNDAVKSEEVVIAAAAPEDKASARDHEVLTEEEAAKSDEPIVEDVIEVKGSGGHGHSHGDEPCHGHGSFPRAPVSGTKISKKQLCLAYRQILQTMKMIAQQMRDYLATTDPASLGLNTESMIAQMQQEFGAALEAIEKQVYEKYAWTDADVEFAQTTFSEDAEVATLLEGLNQEFESLSNPDASQAAAVPDSLTPEVTMRIMRELMQSQGDSMKDTLAKCDGICVGRGMATGAFMAIVRDPTHSQNMEMIDLVQEHYVVAVNEKRNQLQAKFGVSESEITSAIAKYQGVPDFIAQLQELMAQQEQVMKNLGLMSM